MARGGISLPKDFSARVKAAAKLIKKQSFVRVISHYDADGISAAGVMVASLKRMGINFQTSISRSLDRESVERIAEEHLDFIVFLDMGSGQLPAMEVLDAKVIVLDHHRTDRDSKKVVHVNPHLFGLDGMRDISASGLSFLVCEAMDKSNWASAPVAIAGIIGDMQHLNGYSSINSAIIDGAVERKLISRGKGLRLYGDALLDMIADSTSPYFKDLSGNEDNARAFLEKAGLDPSGRYHELSEGARRKLLSLLTLHLLEQNCNSDTISEISGDLLTISSNNLRIDELALLLNACGRTDHPGVGLALCLGDLNALREASKFRGDYERSLLSSLRILEKDGVETMENIQIIRPSNPPLAGAICGISMQYLLRQDMPTIALSRSEGSTKVSSRATRQLVEQGVDLAESLRMAAEPLGGIGGGHNIAAGATVPMAREEEFLKGVDEITSRQKSGAAQK